MNPSKSNTNKSSRSSSPLKSGSSSSIKFPTFVPPVLRDVGKLAAGVAAVSTSSGSATGNPRNKCALQPGHSLMDWIRLGASGKDLTGVGSRAGHLSVTPKELATHNKETDAWLAIRGRVFNVTAYLPFHPGGKDELMKGIGKDATSLFDEIHPWVNYDQILQKCFIGRLATIDPVVDQQALFFGQLNSPPKTPSVKSVPRLVISPEPPRQSPKTPPNSNSLLTTESFLQVQEDEDTASETNNLFLLPRFDWIQKLDYITLVFYTRAFINPLVEVLPPNNDSVTNIYITFDNLMYVNEVVFHKPILWPCQVKVSGETGKIELVYKKAERGIWENYGVLKQKSKAVRSQNVKFNFIISRKIVVNHNVFLLEFGRTDNCKIMVPVGKHVRVGGNVDGEEMYRSYTPVPSSLFTQFKPHFQTTDTVCLMVKRYSDGNVSRYLTDREKGDVVHISKPMGNFSLEVLGRRETFLMVAAGTGITPIFGVIMFLLERRIKKCQFVRLMFFNKTEEDIPFKEKLENLAEFDNRLRIQHILSEPKEDWRGPRGRIQTTLITAALTEDMENTGYTIKDLFTCVCGPNPFNALSETILKDIGFTEEQIHIFQG